MLVAFVALDLDGREYVAVALGDCEVQAKLGCHKMLEFLANRPDQRTVRTQVFGVIRHPAALLPDRAHPRLMHVRLRRASAVSRHRRVRLRLGARRRVAHSIHFP